MHDWLCLLVLDATISLCVGRDPRDGLCFLRGFEWRICQALSHVSGVEMAYEDVVVEVALLRRVVREVHLAVAMLDPPNPLAEVRAAVDPAHFSVPVPLVVLVLALVDVP